MRRTRVNQETPYGAVRMAVVDISLNSVKLLISTKQMNSKIDFDKDESTINILSRTLKNKGVIEGEELDNLIDLVGQYLGVALKYCEPRFTKIISTDVLTKAENKDRITELIEKVWYEKVEDALREKVRFWEKEILKPKKNEAKTSSAKDPDRAKKDFDKFTKLIMERFGCSLDVFFENTEQVKKYVFEEFKPEIIVYSKEEAMKLYYGLILNDVQRSHAKKFPKNSTIVDLTGDYLSIVKCCGGEIESVTELPIGILSYTSKYIKDGNIEKKAIGSIRVPAQKFFQNNFPDVTDSLIFIGGNAINIARICREVPVNRSNDIHGYEIGAANLVTLLEGMCALSYKKRNTLIGLQEGRQNSILSACIIFLEFMDALGVEKAILSTYGLRHKVIIDLLEKNFDNEKKRREFEEFKIKYPEYTVTEKVKD